MYNNQENKITNKQTQITILTHTQKLKKPQWGLGAVVSLFFLKAMYKSTTFTARPFCTGGQTCG